MFLKIFSAKFAAVGSSVRILYGILHFCLLRIAPEIHLTGNARFGIFVVTKIFCRFFLSEGSMTGISEIIQICEDRRPPLSEQR